MNEDCALTAATQKELSVREWDGEMAIPISEWGKDHFSTLAYLETRCVDNRGWIDNDNMRTNPRRHRKLVGDRRIRMAEIGGTGIEGTEKHPTRLANGVVLPKHDDFDCLNDAVEAGLVEIVAEEDRKPS